MLKVDQVLNIEVISIYILNIEVISIYILNIEVISIYTSATITVKYEKNRFDKQF